MAESNDNIRQKIEDSKLTAESKAAIAKVAARKLSEAWDELVSAEEYREMKGNSKADARHAIAQNAYNECLSDFISFMLAYEASIDGALALYDVLLASEDAKNAKKTHLEAEKFEAHHNYSKDGIWDLVGTISGVTEAYNAALDAKKTKNQSATDESAFNEQIEEEMENVMEKEALSEIKSTSNEPMQGREAQKQTPAPQASAEPRHAPHGYMPYGAYQPYYPQANVSIAPASIDISPIIEEAVSAAMKKFSAVFEKRADELSEAASSALVTTDRIVKSEAEIAEAESEIAAKLSEIMSKVKGLVSDLSSVAEACEQLIETEKDVAERQRRVNDMQRSLVREMQGVQANQKVISGEQAALTDSQAALLELQTANAENHKLILAAEGEALDMQKSLLEAQSAIGETVREVVSSHKSIIAAEQAIISANSKNIEQQRELNKKQNELSELQRALMSEQKSIARKVRSQNKSE